MFVLYTFPFLMRSEWVFSRNRFRKGLMIVVNEGIQIVHALGGGTGSGMGCLLAQNIIDEYPDRVLKSYVVMPSWKVSNIQTQPYNLVLSMNHLIECFHQVYYMDNDALYCLCKEVLRLSCVNDDEMNTLIAACMSDITTSLRFVRKFGRSSARYNA